MIRVLVVDDEAPARARFIRMLAKYPYLAVVGEGSDGLMALDQAQKLKPDLIFLDIEMPELDGLGVAQALSQTDGPQVVFVTAYNQHALKAFEVSALDYLVKPVAEDRLEACIGKIQQKIQGSFQTKPELLNGQMEQLRIQFAEGLGRRFAVRTGNRFVVCDPSKVSAVISRDHYSAVIFDGRELLADDSLDELISRLNPQQFLRVHRSAVINVDFLKELEREGDRKYVAILQDSGRTRVPVSRERLPDLKARLGIS